MRRLFMSKVLAIVVLVALGLGSIPVFSAELGDDMIITPFYVRITICSNNLTLNAGGRLTCEGETEVQPGYVAGVKMELQQLTGSSWTTIKTWNGTAASRVYLSQDWYVVNGTYRLQLTHQSLTTGGAVLESVIKYSRTVTY